MRVNLAGLFCTGQLNYKSDVILTCRKIPANFPHRCLRLLSHTRDNLFRLQFNTFSRGKLNYFGWFIIYTPPKTKMLANTHNYSTSLLCRWHISKQCNIANEVCTRIFPPYFAMDNNSCGRGEKGVIIVNGSAKVVQIGLVCLFYPLAGRLLFEIWCNNRYFSFLFVYQSGWESGKLNGEQIAI